MHTGIQFHTCFFAEKHIYRVGNGSSVVAVLAVVAVFLKQTCLGGW